MASIELGSYWKPQVRAHRMKTMAQMRCHQKNSIAPIRLVPTPFKTLSPSLSLSSRARVGDSSRSRMDAIRKQATKLREQVARQQQVFLTLRLPIPLPPPPILGPCQPPYVKIFLFSNIPAADQSSSGSLPGSPFCGCYFVDSGLARA